MLLSSPHNIVTTPKRIISLVPSQTELLYHLGLANRVIGITKFCIWPKEWLQTKPVVGGTKTVKPAVIHQLQPDLIIANKEENTKEQVEALANDHPVWVTDINDLDDALQMIADIGMLTGTDAKAKEMINNIQKGFDELKDQRSKISPGIVGLTAELGLNCAYLIWRKPYMTVGGDTFINDMLHRCGLKNIFAHRCRYPEITIDQLKTADHQLLLLLSSEPYPFKQQHIHELQKQLPHCKIILVDGEMFSWYGSRLLRSPNYFMELLRQL